VSEDVALSQKGGMRNKVWPTLESYPYSEGGEGSYIGKKASCRKGGKGEGTFAIIGGATRWA